MLKQNARKPTRRAAPRNSSALIRVSTRFNARPARGRTGDQQRRARCDFRRLATPIAAKIRKASPPAALRLPLAVVHEHPVPASPSASVAEDEPPLPEPPALVPAFPRARPPVPPGLV